MVNVTIPHGPFDDGEQEQDEQHPPHTTVLPPAKYISGHKVTPVYLSPGNNHHTIDTNTMGNFVTLIILWGLQQPAGTKAPPVPYKHMRACHVMEEHLPAFNMAEMLHGVPAPSHHFAADPQVIVLGSSNLGSVLFLLERVKYMVQTQSPNIRVYIENKAARYTVSNYGIVQPVSPSTGSSHDLANESKNSSTVTGIIEQLTGMAAVKFFLADADYSNDATLIHPMQNLTQPSVRSGGGEIDSFNVKAGGPGRLTGVAYSIPAYSQGKVEYNLQVPVMTSEDIDNLRKGWFNLLDASQKEEYNEHTKKDTSASASLSFFGFLSGGGKVQTSTEKTTDHMKSIGLSPDVIAQAMQMLYELAQKMSTVKAEIEVFNTSNPFPVSGNVLLYSMSGQVTTSQGTRTWRALSSKGQAGDGKAPTDNTFIPNLAAEI